MLLASELYAEIHGEKCEGKDRCHWCGAPCEKKWPHDDLPPWPFIKSKECARFPGQQYICTGCRLYRRSRITVFYLAGGFKDIVNPKDVSWLITDSCAQGIREEDHGQLWKVVLNPPKRFILMLTDGSVNNRLHQAHANDNEDIKLDTPIRYTFNNILHTYTVYEMEEMLKNKDHQQPAAIRTLVDFLRLPPAAFAPEPNNQEQLGQGRPKPLEDARILNQSTSQNRQTGTAGGRRRS